MYIHVSPGEWSSPNITGQPPPPCSFFTFTQVDEKRAALFGGQSLVSGVLNDLFVAELSRHTVVRRKDSCKCVWSIACISNLIGYLSVSLVDTFTKKTCPPHS